MNKAVATALAQIRFETACAIEALSAGGKSKIGAYDEDALYSRLDAYETKLQMVAKAGALGLKKQFAVAKKLLLHSPDARICAALRATHRCKQPATVQAIYELANKLNVWTPSAEPVVVRWIAKPKGGYRPLVISGPIRTAQALLLRDTLSLLGIDSDFDFTMKGGGGEKTLIKNVCQDIENGYDWWWTPDIRNCFGSIKPGHLGWLKIDRLLIRNIAYLPKCAKVILPKQDNAELVLQYLLSKHPDLIVSDTPSLYLLSAQIVRQGLLQGSVLSPLLARAVIKRELNAALSGLECRRYAHFDDLTIGAETKGECGAALQAVTDRLSSLPAGPIELHDADVRSAYSMKVVVLGYVLQPDKGHGSNKVHAKPAIPRLERFRAKLKIRLQSANPDDNLFQVAEQYRVKWFAAQHGWTKVPFHSNDVSAAITETYVDDFMHGLPMGLWHGPVLGIPKVFKTHNKGDV